VSTFPPDPDRAPGIRGRTWCAIAVSAAAGFLALVYALVARVPFLSEDWTHLARMGEVASFAGAFGQELEPWRPLQHAFFWVLAHSGMDPAQPALPMLARAVAFALHGVACWAVYALARAAGLSRAQGCAALLLFAVFPNVKMLAWPAAIGSPGRVAFELVALACFVRRLQTPSPASGCFALVAFVVALNFHESAFLLPAIVLAWAACVGARDVRDGLRRAVAALRDPIVLAACAVSVLWVVNLLFLRPGRHHEVKSLAALPANAAKALLALAPEALREIGVEGLRGHRGTLGWIAAGVAVLLVTAAFVIGLKRGGLARFAVVAIALDLGLAVIGAGFVQRYACLASAFAALALVAWARTRARVATVVVLGALWAYDAVVDALEIRRAGALALRVAADARAAGGDVILMIVGLPDMVGAEEDVPFFNWGGGRFLHAHGGTRAILVRTRPFRTNTDQWDLAADEVPSFVELFSMESSTRALWFDGQGLVAERP